MLTSVRSLLAASALAGALFAAAPAMAQDEEDSSSITVSGNATIVTDYRFRGVGLSGGDAAIQGGFTVSHDSGFYVGTWGSSLEDSPVYGEMELDLYGGWAGDITDGLGADVGVTYYAYPSNDAGAGPSDVIEAYAKLKPSLGPVGLTFAAYYSPDQDSLGGGDNIYLAADAGISIPKTPISLNAHVGYTDGFLTYTANGKAWDYSVGASATVLGAVTVGVSYVGVEGPGGPLWDGITDDTVVGTLGVSF
jgi:uncharacterized protein (TIGR02001 family)